MSAYDKARHVLSARFFREIRKLANFLPPRHIEVILKRYQLDSSPLLRIISDEHILRMEQGVRSESYVIPDGAKVEDFIGPRLLSDKKNFEFTLPERDALYLMRDAVKSKTESWWSKRLRVKELLASMEQEEELDQSEIDSLNDDHNEDGVENEGSTSQDPEYIESTINTQKNRILEQMTNSTDNPDIKEIFGSLMITVLHPLPLTAVTMKQLSAKVRCIDTCKKTLQVQYEDGRNWNAGNFLRHFYKFHSPADAPGRKIVKKRKTSKTTKTNVTSEVPSSQDPIICNDTQNSPANTRDAQNISAAQENQDIAAAQDIQVPFAEHPASCMTQHQVTEQVANSSNLAEDSGIEIDSSIAGPSQMNYSGTLDLSRRASDGSICAEIYAQSSTDGTISVVPQTDSATSLIQLSDFAHA